MEDLELKQEIETRRKTKYPTRKKVRALISWY